MSICKDCLHYDVCKLKHRKYFAEETDVEYLCNQFKPKADYVEVVRCRDCIYWDGRGYDGRCEGYHNGLIRDYTNYDDFCSYGERNESEVQGE